MKSTHTSDNPSRFADNHRLRPLMYTGLGVAMGIMFSFAAGGNTRPTGSGGEGNAGGEVGGEVAGGGCGTNEQCPPGFFCQKNPSDCEGVGACKEKPLNCPAVFAPVCGCNGITYQNACEAHKAGVNVQHDGACIGGQPCAENCECPEGSYCAREPGDCSGPGKCTPKPLGCPDIFDPVCGCNGQTFSNACDAAAAGVNVAFKGLCPSGCLGDLNHDGQVDGADLGLLLGNWGNCQ